MTALGSRIKGLRAERGLQQRQLAEKAGMTPSMVSQIEAGRLTPSLPTLGPRAKGVKTDKVIIDPGQMKLFYVLEGKVALHYNGDTQHLEAGDSAYLDGGTPHGWENIGTKSAKALWVILG